ncbi:MAG: DUF3151 family protein [Nitriliruptoraceae bacterium]
MPDPDPAAQGAFDAALASDPAGRRAAIAEVVAAHPTSIAGWAALAAEGRDPVERYAYARVGYHRGMDALRGAGWGGRGYVRWSTPANRAFLTALVRLRAAAREIAEVDEVARIDAFLRDLDPDWDDDLVVER